MKSRCRLAKIGLSRRLEDAITLWVDFLRADAVSLYAAGTKKNSVSFQRCRERQHVSSNNFMPASVDIIRLN